MSYYKKEENADDKLIRFYKKQLGIFRSELKTAKKDKIAAIQTKIDNYQDKLNQLNKELKSL